MFNIFDDKECMSRIKVMQEFEEEKYSEIPAADGIKWDGMIQHNSGMAILLAYSPEIDMRKKYWLPFSHLRKAPDGLSIYASFWILERAGL